MATETAESKSRTDSPGTGATPGVDPRSSTDPKMDTSNIPAVVADDKARANAVRGVNPVTGAAAYLVEKTIEDPSVSAVALALRASPVGAFHAVDADLRSVEASVKAAELLVNTFREHGICMDVMSEDQFSKENEERARQERILAGQEQEDDKSEDKSRSDVPTTSARSTSTSDRDKDQPKATTADEKETNEKLAREREQRDSGSTSKPKS